MKIIPLKPSRSTEFIDRIWTWIVGIALILAVFGLLAAVVQGVKESLPGNVADWNWAWGWAWSALPSMRSLWHILGYVAIIWLVSPQLERLSKLMNSLQQFLDEKNKPSA
jgi:hypothetical protein